jgi:hypothetical protein
MWATCPHSALSVNGRVVAGERHGMCESAFKQRRILCCQPSQETVGVWMLSDVFKECPCRIDAGVHGQVADTTLKRKETEP